MYRYTMVVPVVVVSVLTLVASGPVNRPIFLGSGGGQFPPASERESPGASRGFPPVLNI